MAGLGIVPPAPYFQAEQRGRIANALTPMSTTSLLGGYLGPMLLGQPASQPSGLMWAFVRRRFYELLEALKITEIQRQNGWTSVNQVRSCLRRHYWGTSFYADDGAVIGSWGKDTQCRPLTDIDLLYLLPPDVYWRYQNWIGNRQSYLLREVKDVLVQTYSRTTLRADGQVVQVLFNNIMIELSPGFRCQDGSIIVPDTNNGGSYTTSTAYAEADMLAVSDVRWNGNTRALIRMTKRWICECNVPLKSFQVERLVIEFLEGWPYSDRDVFYYDWMMRDFLGYLISRVNGCVIMPGTGEFIELGADWLSRARTAYEHADAACRYERDNEELLAGVCWQHLFGTAIPLKTT